MADEADAALVDLTVEAAREMGLCKRCCSFRATGRGREPECVATLWEALNYRHAKPGMCDLTMAEKKRFLEGR